MSRYQSQVDIRPNSIPGAARELGLSVPTVYRLIADGRLRSYRVGRAHRVADQAVRDCIALLEREAAARRVAA